MTTENYIFEIWMVPNGRVRDFMRGMTGAGYPDACHHWGTFDNIDDVRVRYGELAAENFDREGGPCEEYADDQEREKARDAEIARAQETLSLEWQNDLKWVMTRKMRELENGEREFMEVI